MKKYRFIKKKVSTTKMLTIKEALKLKAIGYRVFELILEKTKEGKKEFSKRI